MPKLWLKVTRRPLRVVAHACTCDDVQEAKWRSLYLRSGNANKQVDSWRCAGPAGLSARGRQKHPQCSNSLIAEHWVRIPFQGLVPFSARTLAAARFCSRAAHGTSTEAGNLTLMTAGTWINNLAPSVHLISDNLLTPRKQPDPKRQWYCVLGLVTPVRQPVLQYLGQRPEQLHILQQLQRSFSCHQLDPR